MASLRLLQALRLAQPRLFQPVASTPAVRASYNQQAQLPSIFASSTSLLSRFVACATEAAALGSPTEIGASPLRTLRIWTTQRAFSKKASVKQHATRPKAKVKPAQPRPLKVKPAQPRPVQPAAEVSTVKNRNHKKRMLQRAEFAKKQAQETIKAVRLSIARRDSARVKRWKEGAERARAWAQHLASLKQPRAAIQRPAAVAQ